MDTKVTVGQLKQFDPSITNDAIRVFRRVEEAVRTFKFQSMVTIGDYETWKKISNAKKKILEERKLAQKVK